MKPDITAFGVQHVADGTEPTIEIVAERGRKYQPGETVTGELHLVAPPESGAMPVSLRIERDHRGNSKLLRSKDEVVTLRPRGPGQKFAIRLPTGALDHPSKRQPVTTWLIAEVRGQPEVSARWRLFTGDESVVETHGPQIVDFGRPADQIELPWLFYLVLIALLGFFGYAFSWALGFVVAVVVLGAIGAGLFWALTDDSSSKEPAADHLGIVSLSLSPLLDGSSMLAKAELNTGDHPRIESIAFEWWGREEWRSAGNLGDWVGEAFESLRETVATDPDLAPNAHYEFASSFRLPAPATPSFSMKSERVRWGVNFIVSLEGAPTQAVTATFNVSLRPHDLEGQQAGSVVASELMQDDEDNEDSRSVEEVEVEAEPQEAPA